MSADRRLRRVNAKLATLARDRSPCQTGERVGSPATRRRAPRCQPTATEPRVSRQPHRGISNRQATHRAIQPRPTVSPERLCTSRSGREATAAPHRAGGPPCSTCAKAHSVPNTSDRPPASEHQAASRRRRSGGPRRQGSVGRRDLDHGDVRSQQVGRQPRDRVVTFDEHNPIADQPAVIRNGAGE